MPNPIFSGAKNAEWTTTTRPVQATAGAEGFATDSGLLEYRDAGGLWQQIASQAWVQQQIAAAIGGGLTAPGAVTGLRVTTTSSSTVTLAWGAGTTGGAATAWSVTQQASGGNVVPATGTFGATGGIATGLSSNTTYQFSVTASNSAGISPAATVSGTTQALVTAPGPVTNLTVASISTTSAVLTWGPGTTGSPATSWTVTTNPTGGTPTLVTSTGCTVTTLAQNTPYVFAVVATNTAGSSPAVTVNGTTLGQTVIGISLTPGTIQVGQSVPFVVGTLVPTTSDGLPLASPSYSISSGGAGYAIVSGNQLEATVSPTSTGQVRISIAVTSADPTFTGVVVVTVNPGASGALKPLSAVTYSSWISPVPQPAAGQYTPYGQAVPTNGIGTIVWSATGCPYGMYVDGISGQLWLNGGVAAGSYPIVITGTDGLGNTASTSPTIQVTAGASFWINPPGGAGSPLNFYLDNSSYFSDLSSQFAYIGVQGDSNITLTGGSGLVFAKPFSANQGQLLFYPWPPPAGSYPITLHASGGTSANLTLVVKNEGGPVAAIDFVPATASTAATPGTIVGRLYGSTPFNDANWTLTNSAGGQFSVGSTTGVLTAAGQLIAGPQSFTAQISDGAAGLTYSQSFTLNVVQGNVLPPSNMSVSVASGLTNLTASGTLATATVSGLSGTPNWSISGDGTHVNPGFFAIPRYQINPSGSTGTITINKPLPASLVLNGVDYSDQITISATDGINVCSNTIKLSVAWPPSMPTIHIGPGQTYANFQAYFGPQHDAGWPNPGVLCIVHPDPNDYVGGLWDGHGTTGFGTPVRMIAAPGSTQRVKINVDGQHTNGPANSKYAMGIVWWDFWIQGIELYNCVDGYNGGDDNMDAIGGETNGSGYLWVHDCWIHDNCMGLGRLSTGCKAFMTNMTTERGGQGLPINTHCYYMQWVDLSFCDNCLFAATAGGHEYKSRGWVNILLNSRFFDGEQSAGSFQVNLTEGGILTMNNCVIQKSPNQDNPRSVCFIEDTTPPAPGDAYTDWAPNHVVNISNCTFLCSQRPPDVQTGFPYYAFYTGGYPYGAVSGKPPVVTMSNNSFYGYPATGMMVLNQGATGTNTGVTVLNQMPAMDWTLPVTTLTTTAVQPAANQLKFATPVKAYVYDPVNSIDTTYFPSGTYVTAINQSTGVVTCSANATTAVPSGTAVKFGYGMAGCSLNDPYQATEFTLGNAGDFNPLGNGANPMNVLVGDPPNVVMAPQLVLTRGQQDLRMSVSAGVGTTLFTPTWFPGNSNVSSPHFTLTQVPGNPPRWAIDASTGRVFSAAALVVGADVFLINETNSGYFCYLSVSVFSGSGGGTQAPGPLTNFSVTATTNTTATLHWGAPTSGGVPTSWGVTYTTAIQTSPIPVPGGSFNATGGVATGLTAATAYTFYATAANAAGSGPSVSAPGTTTGTVTIAPGALTSFVVTSTTNTTAVLSWGAPATGGTPTSWTVNYTTATQTTPIPVPGGTFGASGGTATGLTAATAYTFLATATNSAGSSPSVSANGTTTNISGGSLPLLHTTSGPYFLDTSNNGVWLCGSHNWQDMEDVVGAGSSQPQPFAYTAFLAWEVAHGHNFVRLWKWESYQYGFGWTGLTTPLPWVQTSTPGVFDLTQLNQPHFDRILERCVDAAAQGIYVSVMCFSGEVSSGNDPNWSTHPMKSGNNINGINGDPSNTGGGSFIHQQTSGPIWNFETAYVDKLLTTIAGQSNVLIEICNETLDDTATRAWQVAMVNYVKTKQAAIGGLIHPVGITAPYPPAVSDANMNTWMIGTTADWVTFGGTDGSYQYPNIPLAPGTKPVMLDTDHIYGGGGTWQDVYQAFVRGFAAYIVMDDLEDTTATIEAGTINQNIGAGRIAGQDSERDAMGNCRGAALQFLHFATMVPSTSGTTAEGVLRDPAHASYLAYGETSGENFTVDLSGAGAVLMNVVWQDLSQHTPSFHPAGTVTGGSSTQPFTSPYAAWFLLLTPAGSGGTGGTMGDSTAFTGTTSLQQWIASDNVNNTASTLADKSGNGHTMTQASITAQASNLVAPNGRNLLGFNGSSTFYDNSGMASLVSGPPVGFDQHYLMVVAPDTSNSFPKIYSFTDANDTSQSTIVDIMGAYPQSAGSGGGWVGLCLWGSGSAFGTWENVNTPPVDGNLHLLEVINHSNGTLSLAIDGGAYSTCSVRTGSVTFTMGALSGTWATDGSIGSLCSMRFAEFAIVTRVLTGTELQTACQALSTHWGLGLTIPLR